MVAGGNVRFFSFFIHIQPLHAAIAKLSSQVHRWRTINAVIQRADTLLMSPSC